MYVYNKTTGRHTVGFSICACTQFFFNKPLPHGLKTNTHRTGTHAGDSPPLLLLAANIDVNVNRTLHDDLLLSLSHPLALLQIQSHDPFHQVAPFLLSVNMVHVNDVD